MRREITSGSRLYKQFTAETAPAGGRRVRFTVTTSTPDRERDIVYAGGIEVANYLANPVVLWSHDHRTPAIGRTVRLDRAGTGFVAECEFAPAADHPLAEQIFKLVTGGFIRGASIGFRPLEWSYDNERDGVNFRRVELLEWSICNIPANAEALVAAGAAGLETARVKDWARAVLGRDAENLDDEIVVLRDVALPSEQVPAWPQAVVSARQSLTDYLASLGDEGRQPRYDGLRRVVADLTAWLENLSGKATGRVADGRVLVSPAELTAAIRDAVRPLEARLRAGLRQQSARDDEPVIVLADSPDDLLTVDLAELRAVLSTTVSAALGETVRRELTAALNAARGRLD